MTLTDYNSFFESLPGCHILMAADAPNFTIEAVSDCYAEATFTQRDAIIGQNFFDVFSDNPGTERTGAQNLYHSFTEVIGWGKPHKMAVQKYDVRYFNENIFVEKYWDPVNTPVIDVYGKLHVLHTVTDITTAIKLQSAIKQLKSRSDVEEQQPGFGVVPGGILLFSGPNLLAHYCNEYMIDLLGKPRHQVIGAPAATMLSHVLFQHDMLAALYQSYINKEPVYLNKVVLWSYNNMRQFGSSRNVMFNPEKDAEGKLMDVIRYTFHLSIEPVLEKDGSIYGVVAFFSETEA